MHRAIILLPEAVRDAADSYDWYEAHKPGLGEEFLNRLEQAYELIAAHPFHYPVRFDSFRRILVRDFPYAVYFDHGEEAVFIHSVFHCAQDPDKLLCRFGAGKK